MPQSGLFNRAVVINLELEWYDTLHPLVLRNKDQSLLEKTASSSAILGGVMKSFLFILNFT